MNTSLVLRVCESDFSSRNEFVWPSEIGAIANCPDFVDSNKCGNGLHGWLNGMGYSSASDLVDKINAKWLVLEVETDKIIDLAGKVKFPSAKVIFIGSRGECANYIYDRVPNCLNVIGLEKICGDNSKLNGGAYSKLNGGNNSTLNGGNNSTLTGGNNSTLNGGNNSTLTGGYHSALTGGDYSTLTGGDSSTLNGGDGSTLIFQYYQKSTIRIKVAYVGEDGIESNVPYKLDKKFNVVQSMA